MLIGPCAKVSSTLLYPVSAWSGAIAAGSC